MFSLFNLYLKVSPVSLALNWLGSRFIGTPESFNEDLPSDFYYLPGDRLVPSGGELENDPKLVRYRIFVDELRATLHRRVGLLSFALTLAGALVTATATLLIVAFHH